MSSTYLTHFITFILCNFPVKARHYRKRQSEDDLKIAEIDENIQDTVSYKKCNVVHRSWRFLIEILQKLNWKSN